MPACPRCSSSVAEGKRFCSDCGAPISASDAPTFTSVGSSSATPGSVPRPAEERFLPGTVLGGRFRIVGPLGHGGMGEVYRADDLRLGQPVALKFLPAALADDAGRRARFLDEARVALRVTHPNVCRVYDISEVDGHHFISMEYIDGENLASLLRRIGRLPEDKAIEIARQIAAGLAAAHEQGILHRDLKPANVMLDGRGIARITDFGLAGAASAFRGSEVRSGTPGYMAPEQLEGREVTVRSDLYALGLVLYELFTGRTVFQGDTLADVARQHRESAPTVPTSHVSNLDPAVESVILRCLEKDPARRPVSAAAVSAALPGGDPLAAALAAGETPSPELVAAAGASEALAPALALPLSVLAVVLFAVAATLAARNDLRAYVPLEKSPEALEDRAREVVARLGYTEPVYAQPTDRAIGFSTWPNQLNYIKEHDDSPERWQRLHVARPAAVGFWYRQSPDALFPSPRWGSVSIPPVDRWNPFPDKPGEILVGLDTLGRLDFFVCTPKRFATEPPAEDEPDWSAMFALAGLDPAQFTSVEPRYQRFMDPDRRAAWVGRLPEAPEHELRIEAAYHAGRPVFFGLLWPWEIATVSRDPASAPPETVGEYVKLATFLAVFVSALVLARRNLKRGRADLKGATRLAIAVFVLRGGWELLRAPSGAWATGALLYFMTHSALFVATIVLVLYLAVEPYARRIWPQMLTAWSRLVGGDVIRWRDPAVGRAVLVGLFGGTLMVWIWPLGDLLRGWVGDGPVTPRIGNWQALVGQRMAFAGIANALSNGLVFACFITLLIVLVRFIVRREHVAAILVTVGWAVFSGASEPNLEAAMQTMALAGLGMAVFVVMLVRYGFLTAAIAELLPQIMNLAVTPDWSAWFARPAYTALLFVAAIAAYGYWAATAGRKLIPDEAAEQAA